jgi:hypothetical protein
MSTNAINSLSSSYLQSILTSALTSNGVKSNALAPVTTQPDNGQLSPFAQIASTLQQLQQTNPTEYQQVTQTIATNLTTAAQTAQSDGNMNAANQLTQLASDFTTASKNGTLHHDHAAAASSDSDSTDSSSTSLSPLSIISNALSG